MPTPRTRPRPLLPARASVPDRSVRAACAEVRAGLRALLAEARATA